MLRELLRNLQAFESLYLAEGIDIVKAPDGAEYCLTDLRRLYDQRHDLLTHRWAQAIEMFLYHDMRESDAARAMGLSPGTPVAIYATKGLRILAEAWEGGTGGLSAIADEAPARHLQGA